MPTDDRGHQGQRTSMSKLVLMEFSCVGGDRTAIGTLGVPVMKHEPDPRRQVDTHRRWREDTQSAFVLKKAARTPPWSTALGQRQALRRYDVLLGEKRERYVKHLPHRRVVAQGIFRSHQLYDRSKGYDGPQLRTQVKGLDQNHRNKKNTSDREPILSVRSNFVPFSPGFLRAWSWGSWSCLLLWKETGTAERPEQTALQPLPILCGCTVFTRAITPMPGEERRGEGSEEEEVSKPAQAATCGRNLTQRQSRRRTLRV